MSIYSKMTAIADAIREKTGGTNPLTLDAMAEAIAGIETGGGVDHSAEDSMIQSDVLVEYRNDRVTDVRPYCFSNCNNLVSIDLPNVYKIREATFAFCGKLSSINLPSLTTFSSWRHFQACTSLAFIKLPKITGLENESFSRCTNLKTIVLPQTKLVTLGTINVFSQTPYASGGTGGTVYVPSALISEYQQATNWSTLYAAGTCNFVAIEGSEYE